MLIVHYIECINAINLTFYMPWVLCNVLTRRLKYMFFEVLFSFIHKLIHLNSLGLFWHCFDEIWWFFSHIMNYTQFWGAWPELPWLKDQNIKCKTAVLASLQWLWRCPSVPDPDCSLWTQFRDGPVILPGISESRRTDIWPALLRAKEKAPLHSKR